MRYVFEIAMAPSDPDKGLGMAVVVAICTPSWFARWFFRRKITRVKATFMREYQYPSIKSTPRWIMIANEQPVAESHVLHRALEKAWVMKVAPHKLFPGWEVVGEIPAAVAREKGEVLS
jgi:hypothetical protein